MSINLKKLLKQKCRSRNLDLYSDLNSIRDSTYRIWESQRLDFFTDHRAQTHSEEIIRILGELVEGIQERDKYALNAPEIFILLAASYLHDIGMQDLRDNEDEDEESESEQRGIEDFNSDDYRIIRERHPKRGAELIRRGEVNPSGGLNPFHFNLKNPSYTELIAKVSKSHGSKHFESCVDNLKNDKTRLEGKKVRPDLLAALLMIADELHIHQDRARIIDGVPLSPISKLHNYANHYVTGVDVNLRNGLAEITLNLSLPNDADSYERYLKLWFSIKLTRQFRRANRVFRGKCGGALKIKEQVVFNPPDRSKLRKSLPDPAKSLLKREVFCSKVVDRSELLALIREKWFGDSSSFECIVIEDNTHSDWTSILRVLESDAEVKDALFFNISFEESVAHSPDDLVVKLKNQLGISEKGDALRNDHKNNGVDSSDKGFDSLINHLKELSSHSDMMLLIGYPERSDKNTKRWISEKLANRLEKYDIDIFLTIVVKDSNKHKSDVEDILDYANLNRKLDKFSIDDIFEYLYDTRGFSSEEAQKKATEIYEGSVGGYPEGVIKNQEVSLNSEIIVR